MLIYQNEKWKIRKSKFLKIEYQNKLILNELIEISFIMVA